MQEAAELAGHFAAHAVWCVAEGETLVPILAYRGVDGSESFRRIEGPELADCVEEGRTWLASGPDGVACAVLVYDGFVTLQGGKTDALILDVRSYVAATSAIQVALPYRHASKPGGFAVHRPKILSFSGVEPDWESVVTALFAGVERHKEGAVVWNAHLDESR